MVIFSYKYVVSVLRYSDRLHNNDSFWPYDWARRKTKLATQQDIVYCYKDDVLPNRKYGLVTFYGHNLNDFIIFLTWGVSSVCLLLGFKSGLVELD